MISVSEVLDRLLDAKKRNQARLWGAYSLTYLPLGASASNQKATVTTQGNSDFVALRMKAYATDTAAPPVVLTDPQATLDLTVGSNDVFPDGNPLHLGTFASSTNDRRGHDFEFPLWIPRQTTLVGLLSNLTATAMNVRITFFGIQILDAPRGNSGF